MASVNKVILVGRLGADPEVRSFQNGGKVANLRIATTLAKSSMMKSPASEPSNGTRP